MNKLETAPTEAVKTEEADVKLIKKVTPNKDAVGSEKDQNRTNDGVKKLGKGCIPIRGD